MKYEARSSSKSNRNWSGWSILRRKELLGNQLKSGNENTGGKSRGSFMWESGRLMNQSL